MRFFQLVYANIIHPYGKTCQVSAFVYIPLFTNAVKNDSIYIALTVKMKIDSDYKEAVRVESYFFIIIGFMFLIIYLTREKQLTVLFHKIRKKKRGKTEMTDLVKNYIGKECLIYTCTSSSQITGIIKSCQDGWIEIENNGTTDIVNCDYITRIREYPKNKKGKKKSVVLD